MLKYMQRAQKWKNSTGTNEFWDTKGEELAISYGWWVYLKMVGCKLVLNRHAYSPTTGRHIRETWDKISPDIIIREKVESSLDNTNGVIRELKEAKQEVEAWFKNPRTKKHITVWGDYPNDEGERFWNDKSEYMKHRLNCIDELIELFKSQLKE